MGNVNTPVVLSQAKSGSYRFWVVFADCVEKMISKLCMFSNGVATGIRISV